MTYSSIKRGKLGTDPHTWGYQRKKGEEGHLYAKGNAFSRSFSHGFQKEETLQTERVELDCQLPKLCGNKCFYIIMLWCFYIAVLILSNLCCVYIKPDHLFLIEFSLHLPSMTLFLPLLPFTNTKPLVFIRELHHSYDFKSIFQVMKYEYQTIYFHQYLFPEL